MKKITWIFVFLFSVTAYSQVDQRIVSPGTVYTDELWPLNVDWGYTRMASIYWDSDINHTGGQIVEVLLNGVTTVSDSIPMKLYMMSTSMDLWSGDWTWNGIVTHPLMECVFDGKVAFQNGFCKVVLDTPLDYFGVTLNVAWEINWGGTGLDPAPTFTNKEVSIASRRSLVWTSNTTPPAGTVVGTVSDVIPVLALRINKPGPDPVTSTIAAAMCGGYDSLKWTNNAANDSVIIVASYSGQKPYFMNGYSFAVGYPIDAMHNLDTVIFKGKASQFNYYHHDTDVNHRKYYFWNYSIARQYSESNYAHTWGLNEGLLSENFDASTSLPIGWTMFMGPFLMMPGHGVTGNAASINFSDAVMIGSVTSSRFCGAESDSYLRFKYRYVNKTGYPSTATPASSIVSLNISLDNGVTNTLYTVTNTNHVESTNYATIEIPIGSYVDGGSFTITFAALHNSGTGDYYLDIDDVEVYNLSSVEEISQNSIILYPNPASETITLSTDYEMYGSKISVIGFSGQTLKNITHNGSAQFTIDISDLPTGLYLLRIENEGTVDMRKFIKL